MPLTDADKLELKEIVAAGVREGLSRIGLGADTEEEVKALQADQAWLRERRQAWQDMVKTIRRGLVRGGLVGLGGVILFAATHPGQFAGFLAHLFAKSQ